MNCEWRSWFNMKLTTFLFQHVITQKIGDTSCIFFTDVGSFKMQKKKKYFGSTVINWNIKHVDCIIFFLLIYAFSNGNIKYFCFSELNDSVWSASMQCPFQLIYFITLNQISVVFFLRSLFQVKCILIASNTSQSHTDSSLKIYFCCNISPNCVDFFFSKEQTIMGIARMKKKKKKDVRDFECSDSMEWIYQKEWRIFF